MTPPHAADHPPPGSDTQPAPLDGHRLLSQLGREVTSSLSPALERVASLAATGRIDRLSLRALHDEVGAARRAGIAGQQLSRLAQGRVTLTSERLALTALVQEALAQRQPDIDSRGIVLRPVLAAADVVSDARLLLALLLTALDWSFAHAAGRIDLKLELRGTTRQARLRSAFAYHLPANDAAAAHASAALDTLAWRLLEQAALVLGLALRRRDARGRTELVLDFPLAPEPAKPSGSPAGAAAGTLPVAAAGDAPASVEADPVRTRAAPAAPAGGPAQLAGFHVLVLARKREVREQVRDALHGMGLLLDFVTSVDEARLFCAAALPHALVYEAAHADADFERLRNALLLQRPALGLVQIGNDGTASDTLATAGSAGGRDHASVGRNELAQSLPAALTFALFRDR